MAHNDDERYSLDGEPDPGGHKARKRSWFRRHEENDRQWEAFRAFRDTPPRERSVRSMTAFGSRNALNAWRAQHEWDKRVADYDAFRDRKAYARGGDADKAREHRRAVLRYSGKVLSQAYRRLEELSKKGGIVLDPKSLMKLTELYLKFSRLEFGEVTEIVDRRSEVQALNLDALSAEELEQLKALQAKARAPVQSNGSDDDEGEGGDVS